MTTTIVLTTLCDDDDSCGQFFNVSNTHTHGFNYARCLLFFKKIIFFKQSICTITYICVVPFGVVRYIEMVLLYFHSTVIRVLYYMT